MNIVFFQGLVVALSGVVAIKANAFLLAASVSPLTSLIFSAGAAVIVRTFLLFLITEGNRWRFLRCIIDPRSKFEGHWIIRLKEHIERPYAYACIQYNPDSKSYMYRGAGFDIDGNLGSHWLDPEIKFDLKSGKIEYLAEATLTDSDGEILKNWGHITFEKDTFGNEYTRGQGFFVDFGTVFRKSHFSLDRLYEKDIHELTKLKKIKTHDDMSLLMVKYHLKRLSNKPKEHELVKQNNHPLFFNLIQVAGVIDEEEASLIVNSGVKILGFPLRLDFHKPDLSECDAGIIIKKLDSNIHCLLITHLDNAEEILNLCNDLNVNIVQIYADIIISELIKIKHSKPEIIIIKSLIVGKQTLVSIEGNVNELSPYVDAFIVDTYDPETRSSGATGKAHDWNVSKKIVEISPKPVILAGGLTPKNVKSAILNVKPAGVDVHTGVEDETGRKKSGLIKKFIAEADSAFTELSSQHLNDYPD